MYSISEQKKKINIMNDSMLRVNIAFVWCEYSKQIHNIHNLSSKNIQNHSNNLEVKNKKMQRKQAVHRNEVVM